jgi:hypothetical protein
MFEDPDFREHLLVLQYVVQTPQLRQAVPELQRIGYFHEYEILGMVFNIIYQYDKEYDTIAPVEVLENELSEVGAHIQGDIRSVLVRIYEPPSTKDYQYIKDIIKASIETHNHQEVKRSLAVETDPTEIDRIITNAATQQSRGVLNEINLIDPIAELEYNLVEESLIPFGIDFLDEILDGGVTVGEMIGILAPSGGGKTSLALQIIKAQILVGNPVLHISTEQGIRGDITRRICMMLTGEERNMFKGASFSSLPLDVQNTLRIHQERLAGLYKFWDFKKDKNDFKDAEALFSPIRMMKEAGLDPKLVVLDWWGNMKDSLEANFQSTGSDNQNRRFGRDLLNTIRRWAEEYEVIPIIFHQLSGEAASKKTVPSTHSAQEDRNFNNPFDYCFAFSQRDSDEIATLNADKARGASRTKMQVRLDPQSGAWTKLDNEDAYLSEDESPSGWDIGEEFDTDGGYV